MSDSVISIYGYQLTRKDLLKHVGDISQIADVRLIEFTNGNERGVRAAEFYTGSGFEFTVLFDRGMDIDDARFKGVPVSWQSANGPVSPAFYDWRGTQLLRNFAGSMLMGCGPTSVGMPAVDGGEELGLHGRLSNTPAKDICVKKEWQGNDYVMSVEGSMFQGGLFLDSLRVSRRIEVRLGESRLRLKDAVVNVGVTTSPFCMLYHCQIGWPILSPNSRLYIKHSEREPWNLGKVNMDAWDTFLPPTPGFAEEIIYVTADPDADGMANAALINPDFNDGRGYGVYFRWTQSTMPYLVFWKMLGEKGYVVGCEIGNAISEGRSRARELGILRHLEPDEVAETDVEIGLLTSPEEIENWKAKYA
jgi:hypothetical protein